MPSRHPALALTSFVVTGSNVGCTVAHSSVRCEIVQRVWAPPAQPSTCKATWGNAILLEGTAPTAFACGGTAPISAGATVIPDGWDDQVGQITCQVRTFGVNCFSSSHHGFILSRTGYGAGVVDSLTRRHALSRASYPKDAVGSEKAQHAFLA